MYHLNVQFLGNQRVRKLGLYSVDFHPLSSIDLFTSFASLKRKLNNEQTYTNMHFE